MTRCNLLIMIVLASTLMSCLGKIDVDFREKGATNGAQAATDSAPLVSNATPANGTEDTESIITLSYTDADGDKATSCSVTNLSNITITSACSCDGAGVCTVGTTGTLNFNGAASFDYSVTANSVTSSLALISYTIDFASISCPTGFIAVNGNGVLGTVDFCVMKYEAKCDGAGACNFTDSTSIPVSQAAGLPWVSIRADESAAAGSGAQARCEAMSEVGFTGTFSLISNPEWMTIARDIESVATNWSSGTVGTGNLARGWSANTVDDGFQNSAVAPTTDASCVFNSAANTCAATGTHKLRRTHQLSNGSEIWDLSGNVWEWVDWDAGIAGFTTGPTDGDTGGWNELNDLVGSLTVDDVAPLGPYTSAEQAGRLNPYTSGGAALRGGIWFLGTNAGAFSLALHLAPSNSNRFIGFRCSYRP